MKNKHIYLITCLLLLSMLFSSCAPETPFQEPVDNSQNSSNGVNNSINSNNSSPPPYKSCNPKSLEDLEAWVLENNKYIFPEDIEGYYAFYVYMEYLQRFYPNDYEAVYDKYYDWVVDKFKLDFAEDRDKAVENIRNWFEFVKECYPNDYPEMAEEYYKMQTDNYGDIEYHINEISKRGYLTFSDPDNIVEWYSCTLYEADGYYRSDMMMCYSYETENVRVNLPCNVMYIPEEYMDLAESSPVECIKTLYEMELYYRESPQIQYNGKKLYHRMGHVNIGGGIYQAIFGEYFDAEGNRDLSSGFICFIYNDVLIKINRSYSNPDVRYVLEKVEISMTVPTKD